MNTICVSSGVLVFRPLLATDQINDSVKARILVIPNLAFPNYEDIPTGYLQASPGINIPCHNPIKDAKPM
jgi:hypothetical protein